MEIHNKAPPSKEMRVKTIEEVFDLLADAVHHTDPLPWVWLEEGVYQTPQGILVKVKSEDQNLFFSVEHRQDWYIFAVLPAHTGDPLLYLQNACQPARVLHPLTHSLVRRLLLQHAPGGAYMCSLNPFIKHSQLLLITPGVNVVPMASIFPPASTLPALLMTALASCAEEQQYDLYSGPRFESKRILCFDVPYSQHDRLAWLAKDRPYLFEDLDAHFV